MPQIVTCGNCQRKLRVPDDLLGKRVKCPSCQNLFTARSLADPDEVDEEPRRGAAAARNRRREAPPEPDEDAPPPRRRPRLDDGDDDVPSTVRAARNSPREGWQKVLTGLTLHVAALALIVVYLVFATISGIASGLSTRPALGANPNQPPFGPRGMRPGQPPDALVATGPSTISTLVSVVCFMLLATSRILVLVAYAFYMFVPPRTNAGGLAKVTFGLGIGQLLVGLVLLLTSFMTMGASLANFNPMLLLQAGMLILVLGLLALVMAIGEVVCSLLYFQSVASYLRNHSLANGFYYLLLLGVGIVLVYLGIMGTMMLTGFLATTGGGPISPDQMRSMAGIGMLLFACCCIDGIALFAWQIWYAVNVILLRGDVDRHVSRN